MEWHFIRREFPHVRNHCQCFPCRNYYRNFKPIYVNGQNAVDTDPWFPDTVSWFSKVIYCIKAILSILLWGILLLRMSPKYGHLIKLGGIVPELNRHEVTFHKVCGIYACTALLTGLLGFGSVLINSADCRTVSFLHVVVYDSYNMN